MLSEVATYHDRLNALREQVLKTLEGLDAETLNWKPLASDTNSLFVLATHLIGSEHGWLGETLAGEPKTRVRPEEFVARGDNLNDLAARFEETARDTTRILAGLKESDLEQMFPEERRGTVSGRWIILHVIEHYAEHLGQMRLTRQLAENRRSAG